MNRYYVDWDEIKALVFRLSHKIITNDLKLVSSKTYMVYKEEV